MKRTPTGIPGFDRITDGGLPENSNNVIYGPHGAGKTIMGMQFLHNGYLQENEPGILIQIEEFDSTLYWYSKTFDWKIKELEEKNRLKVYSINPEDYSKFAPNSVEGEILSKIEKIVKALDAKRLVIDSISPLRSIMDTADYRYSLYKTMKFLKKLDLTTMILTEEGSEYMNESDLERHMADSAINLTGKSTLLITKMLATKLRKEEYPFSIKKGQGMNVRPFV